MYQEYLDLAIDLAKQAAQIQLRYFRTNDLQIDTKLNVYDVVTQADKESEELIVRSILNQYPHHQVLGEEGGLRGTEGSDYLWVIDPLDGTTNYSQGLPIFCVSIALQYKGETIAGAVYMPYLRELFTATRGGGAYMQCADGERKKIHVSTKTTLERAVLATGFPYDKDVNPDNNSDNVASILPHVRELRRMGAAAYDLSCLAAGLLDGFWELDIKRWDVCAANLIIEEAGGIIRPLRTNRNVSQIAGNPAIVDVIAQYVR